MIIMYEYILTQRQEVIYEKRKKQIITRDASLHHNDRDHAPLRMQR